MSPGTGEHQIADLISVPDITAVLEFGECHAAKVDLTQDRVDLQVSAPPARFASRSRVLSGGFPSVRINARVTQAHAASMIALTSVIFFATA